MIVNKVKIYLDLRCRYTDIIPKISISIDDVMTINRGLDQIDPCLIDIDLGPGRHRLCIDFNDAAALAQDPNISIEVRSLKLQNLPDEFNIYSFYRPMYPKHWVEENLALGKRLDPVIHSNCIGWCGQWWIDFETPIYAWIHKRLNLGWLLDAEIRP